VTGAGEDPRFPIPRLATVLVVVYAGSALILGLLGVATLASDREFAFFSREPATAVAADGCEGGDCSYAGLLSNLGVVVWSTAAVVCFVVALMGGLWRRPAGYPSAPFLWAGVFTSLLLFDDMLAIHDEAIPTAATRISGALENVAEPAAYALLALLGLALAVRFRGFLARTTYGVLVAAVVLIGLSTLLDLAEAPHFLEDGPKFLGIATWATYLAGTGVAVLQRYARA
jgi:hypothetical protein